MHTKLQLTARPPAAEPRDGRPSMHMWRALALALLLVQQGGVTGLASPQKRLRKRGRQKQRATPSAVAKPAEVPTVEGTDSGARWRLRLVRSGSYLRCTLDRAVTTSPSFFSLFEVRSVPRAEAVIILCHGIGPLGLAPGDARSDGHPRLTAAGASLRPQQLWLHRIGDNRHLLWLDPAGAVFLRELGPSVAEDERQPTAQPAQLVVANTTTSRSSASMAAIVELERILAPTSERANRPGPRDGSFAEKVRGSAMTVEGRRVVLATYHNVGMMDWAVLFWKWLIASHIQRLLLLDLDGLTCAAGEPLNAAHAPELRIACASVAEMALPTVQLGEAGAVQDWGTRTTSGYFKFLQLKLRIVELVLAEGADAIIADVDVLVINPAFVATMVRTQASLAISSDARTGSYDDNQHCPCSNRMYQVHSADWVCAGLFYLRSGSAGSWFIRYAQRLMVQYAITDQDAIQVILTGHTQVAMPQVPLRKQAKAVASGGRFQEGQASPLSPGYRPSGDFLKPLWLEDLTTPGNLRDLRNIQALNTPMRQSQWLKLQQRQRAVGFTWEALSLKSFGNGPVLVDQWPRVFRLRTRQATDLLSIHANCFSKTWLESDVKGSSFLLWPPSSTVNLSALTIGADSGERCTSHANCGRQRWCDDLGKCRRCQQWDETDRGASITGETPPGCHAKLTGRGGSADRRGRHSSTSSRRSKKSARQQRRTG